MPDNAADRRPPPGTWPLWPAVVIPTHVVWNDVGGEDLVLFDRADGSYHALNAVARTIWRGIAQGREIAVIVDELAHAHAQDESIIAADVRVFLTEAIQKGLLVPRATSPA